MVTLRYKSRLSKRKLLTLSISLIALGIILFSLEKRHVIDLYGRTNTDEVQQPEYSINYGPPTEEEKKAGDKQKEVLNKKEVYRNDTSDQNKKTASVIITDAGLYDEIVEVRAFIPDHYQDGTCIITFTRNSLKVEKSTPAYRDVSTTICTNPLFARSEFVGSDDWQLIVSYISDGAQGASEPKTITIH